MTIRVHRLEQIEEALAALEAVFADPGVLPQPGPPRPTAGARLRHQLGE